MFSLGLLQTTYRFILVKQTLAYKYRTAYNRDGSNAINFFCVKRLGVRIFFIIL